MRQRVIRGLPLAFLALVSALIASGIQTVLEKNGTGFGNKTLFDWLDVFIFPFVIAVFVAGGAYWLDRQQRIREREADERRRQRELDVQQQRSQHDALQAYFER